MNLMKKFFYHDALIMANYYLCNTFITKINIYYSECQLCFTWASQSLIQNFCFKREKSFYFKYDWEPLSYYFLKYSSLVYFLIFYFLIKWGIKLWKTLKRRKIYIQLKYNFRIPFINSTFLSISLSTTKWWTFMLLMELYTSIMDNCVLREHDPFEEAQTDSQMDLFALGEVAMVLLVLRPGF